MSLIPWKNPATWVNYISFSKVTGCKGGIALCECIPRMDVGKVSLSILREWGIWPEDEYFRWNTLLAIRVEDSGRTSSLTQVPTFQPIQRACIQVYVSVISMLYTGSLPFPALQNTNSSYSSQFHQINSHQHCPTKHLRTHYSNSWPCNIGMMYYTKLMMSPGTSICSELSFP